MQMEWRLRAAPTQRHSRTTPGSKLKADLLFGSNSGKPSSSSKPMPSLHKPSTTLEPEPWAVPSIGRPAERATRLSVANTCPSDRAKATFLSDGHPQATRGRSLQQSQCAVEA